MKNLYNRVAAVIGATLFAVSPINVSAQDSPNSISGKVFEHGSNLLLRGTEISLVGSPVGTTTDAKGTFRLSELSAEIYELRFSFLGYRDTTVTVDLRSESSQNVEVRLKPDVLELSEVIIHPGHPLDRVNAISQVDINLRPVDNSQDILRIVPGLFTGQHAGGGKAEQLFLRGFDNDHGTDFNITVDDMPVNMVSHAHGQGYSDLHFVIPETIQKVDFDKGPYHADKGNFATTGFAAFATKRALDRSKLSIEAGQYDTFRGTALLNIFNSSSGKTHAYAAGEYLDKEGYFESGQDFTRLNVFGKYSTIVKDDLRLSTSASFFDSEWLASGQIPLRAVENGIISRYGAIDDSEGGNTSRANVNVILDYFYSDNLLWKHQAYYTHYDFLLFSNFTFFLADPVNGDQIRQTEDRNIFGYNGASYFNGHMGRVPVTSTIGAGFRYDDVNNIRLSRTSDRMMISSDLAKGKINESNAFAYLNEEVTVTDQLMIHAGLRFDFFNFQYTDDLQPDSPKLTEQNAILSPKLSLEYKFNTENKLYAKSGTGFHSNDTRAVVARGGKQVLPRAYSFDLGMITKPIDRLIANPVIWLLYLEQEFVFSGDEGFVEPSGRTRRMGADLSLRYQLLDWLYADLDVNYTYARYMDEPIGANRIPLAPDITSIAGFRFDLENGINGSLRYRAIADRPLNENNSLTADGYFVIDAICNYRFRQFEAGVSVQNLLNVEWRETQFAYESQMRHESDPVYDNHFTPGTPFYAKTTLSYHF